MILPNEVKMELLTESNISFIQDFILCICIRVNFNLHASVHNNGEISIIDKRNEVIEHNI
jgi:hypothetical protein